MAYKPTTNGNLIDDDFRLATSEAVVEGLKLKVNAPASAGTASQILSLVNPTTGETSWIDNTGAGANTSLSNLSATAINAVLRGLDGDATAPAYSFTSDTNTGVYLPAADILAVSTGGVERMRITSSGNVLIGLNFTSARSNFNNGSTIPRLQIEGADNNQSAISITDNNNAASISPSIYFGKSRGGTIGSNTIVQNGDQIGALRFQGNNGTNMISSSIIRCAIDGTPSATSMPSRLEFFTTPDGTTTVTERMRIASTGNVGIGSTNPQAVLDLGSPTLGRAITWGGLNGTTRYASIFTPFSSSGIVLATGFHGDAATDTYLSSFTGTYRPAGIRIDFSSSSGGGIRFFTDQSAAYTAGAAFTPTQRMIISSSGNVGVGTNAPNALLTVSSQGTGASAATISINSYNNTANGSNLVFLFARGTEASPTATQNNDVLGFIGARGYGATGFSNASRNSITFNAAETFTDTAQGTYITFGTTPTGSTTRAERMRIDSTGNVGIGTTTPTNRLEVQVANSSLVTALALSNHINYASGRGVGISFRVPLDTPFTTSYAGGFIGSTSEGGSGAGNSNLIFQTASSQTLSERMRINDAGNVGIGTATPATKLEVRTATGYTEERLITLSRQEPTRYNGYMEFGSPSGAFFTLTLGTRNNNVDFPALKLYDGSVGIGGGTPANANDRLHIFGVGGTNTFIKNRTTAAIPVFRGERQNGTTASPTAIVSGNELMNVSAAGYDGAAFSTGRAGLSMFAAENWTNAAQGAYLTFSTTPTGSTTIAERMRINAAGNVAIGLTNPESRLHVAETTKGLMTISKVGDATANEDYAEIRFRAIQNNYSVAGYASIVAFTQSAADQNGLKFITRNASTPTERMRIDSAGNVGIGTTTPTEKLTVDGNTQITGTARRIVADFTSPLGDRCSFVTSTTNGNTSIQALPNGTATLAAFTAYNNSDPANSATAQIIVTDAEASIRSNITGTGTYLPMTFLNGGLERMRITTGGEVYIAGTTDRGAYNLQCNGTGVWGAGAYVNGSDERIKEEINMLESGLDVVEKLNPVTYRYKKEWSKDQSVQTGFIAQELLTALEGKNYIDGIVQQGESDGYYSVAYQNITPILTKAIQELKQLVDQQAAKIAELEAKLNSNE